MDNVQNLKEKNVDRCGDDVGTKGDRSAENNVDIEFRENENFSFDPNRVLFIDDKLYDFKEASKAVEELAANPEQIEQITNDTLKQTGPLKAMLITIVGGLVSKVAKDPMFRARAQIGIIEDIHALAVSDAIERIAVARPIVEKADAALKDNAEDIIRGFAGTSEDPYVAGRQERVLRQQAGVLATISGKLDALTTGMLDRAKLNIISRQKQLDDYKQRHSQDPTTYGYLKGILIEQEEGINKDRTRLAEAIAEKPAAPKIKKAAQEAALTDHSWAAADGGRGQKAEVSALGEMNCAVSRATPNQDSPTIKR